MQAKKSGKKPTPHSANPFARALAEMEKSSSHGSFQSNTSAESQLNGNRPQEHNAAQLQEQQAERLKKERLRKKLHDQVNPVNAKDIFSAREQQVKKEIEQLRQELKLLVQDVKKFHKDVEVAVLSNIAEPGQNGTYYINFFKKLRAFIMLLRQKIKSARTWATQMHSKQKKKKKRGSAGLKIGGGRAEQGKAVFDQMHHEVGSTYANG